MLLWDVAWCQFFVLLWPPYFVEFFYFVISFQFCLLRVPYFVMTFFFSCDFFICCEFLLLLWVFNFVLRLCFCCEFFLSLWVFLFLVSFQCDCVVSSKCWCDFILLLWISIWVFDFIVSFWFRYEFLILFRCEFFVLFSNFFCCSSCGPPQDVIFSCPNRICFGVIFLFLSQLKLTSFIFPSDRE